MAYFTRPEILLKLKKAFLILMTQSTKIFKSEPIVIKKEMMAEVKYQYHTQFLL